MKDPYLHGVLYALICDLLLYPIELAHLCIVGDVLVAEHSEVSCEGPLDAAPTSTPTPTAPVGLAKKGGGAATVCVMVVLYLRDRTTPSAQPSRHPTLLLDLLKAEFVPLSIAKYLFYFFFHTCCRDDFSPKLPWRRGQMVDDVERAARINQSGVPDVLLQRLGATAASSAIGETIVQLSTQHHMHSQSTTPKGS